MALTKVIGAGLGEVKGASSADLTIDAPTDNATLTLKAGSSDSGAEGAFAVFIQNTTNKWQMGMNTDNSFRLYSYAASAEVLNMDSTGAMTKPLQPACLAFVGTQMNNLIVGNTTIEFDSEVYDQNSDFDTSSYRFTAPITGRYLINFSLYGLNLDAGANYIEPFIFTSNRSYYTGTFDPDNGDGYDLNYKNFQGSVVADMDANDIVTVIVTQGGGNAQMDVATNSFISVTLLC